MHSYVCTIWVCDLEAVVVEDQEGVGNAPQLSSDVGRDHQRVAITSSSSSSSSVAGGGCSSGGGGAGGAGRRGHHRSGIHVRNVAAAVAAAAALAAFASPPLRPFLALASLRRGTVSGAPGGRHRSRVPARELLGSLRPALTLIVKRVVSGGGA